MLLVATFEAQKTALFIFNTTSKRTKTGEFKSRFFYLIF